MPAAKIKGDRWQCAGPDSSLKVSYGLVAAHGLLPLPAATPRRSLYCETDLPLNFHPAAIRVSANVTPFGAVSVPA
jgi:hypothetical protein